MEEFPVLVSPVALRLGSERRSSQQTLEVRSPVDRGLVGRVALAGPVEVSEAIGRAFAARTALARATAVARRKALDVAASALAARADEAARGIVAEAAKPISLARLEVDRAITTLRASAEEAGRAPWGEVVPLETAPGGAGRRGQLRRFPRGVVAAVTPFNFPLNLACHKVGPALAAGCPVVLKPSEKTPLTAHLLGDVVADGLAAAGLPADAWHVVPALPADSGPLLSDARVATFSFTGGAATGWKLRERAGRKHVLLELGGDAAAIVWRDADLAHAAKRAAATSFAYAGQICIKLQRIYVDARVHARFLELFLAETRALAVGDPSDPAVLVGPLIDDAAADRVAAWIDEAVRGGARVLAGGPRSGRTIPPTVLEGAPAGVSLACEEVFGPVTLVERVTRFDEALERVNSSRFGLQAALFTRDVRRIEAAFERLEVGALVVGDGPSFRVDTMPYGGVKESGAGREGIRAAIESFTEPRVLVLAGDDAADLDA